MVKADLVSLASLSRKNCQALHHPATLNHHPHIHEPSSFRSEGLGGTYNEFQLQQIGMHRIVRQFLMSDYCWMDCSCRAFGRGLHTSSHFLGHKRRTSQFGGVAAVRVECRCIRNSSISSSSGQPSSLPMRIRRFRPLILRFLLASQHEGLCMCSARSSSFCDCLAESTEAPVWSSSIRARTTDQC